MIGSNLRAILFILLTLVAQNLSFARVDKDTHIEFTASEWKSYNGYVPRVMESHVIDKSWLIELVRFEPSSSGNKLITGFMGTLGAILGAGEEYDVHYALRARCLKEVCDELRPKSININFKYSMSGTTPVVYNLRNVELGSYAFIGQSLAVYCVITPTLKEAASVNSISNEAKLPRLAIANIK
ncbi:MAG: hypothetical protein R3A80_06350 [Bdellovibrionota bacterium]